jgi:acyl-coenzyme A synthetase/AMP-(fatty) acid ligase
MQVVCQLANYLRSIGVGKGDDVSIYMPMVPELPAAMVRPAGMAQSMPLLPPLVAA